MSPQSPTRPSAQERLLEAAAARFYSAGVAATGIDAITADAGVAKMSLYNNFASKADLVEAYLQRRHEEWLDLYAVRLAPTRTPQERVLAVFDAYADHAATSRTTGFRGCGLLNAAAELADGDPGRAVVREHKRQVQDLVEEQLVTVLDPAQAHALAVHLSFLLEGSMARAGLEGDLGPLGEAREIAAQLVGA
ncbi:TetR family transcriptional regulator [Serinicoccus sp. CUA-874]|uniref:TetR/AcrR family transcriptional regulator n=1 Tax=Serinicoccus sp. CUA-874 TaxID=1517939 RepID=UPI00095E2A65|nr:TetR/AcrR family transcriptional regulator [Serinicoccus sp. CUA-874]OLT16300.1 TetR family transcriptional regulator [Serinicoccus sp. CUA-874]